MSDLAAFDGPESLVRSMATSSMESPVDDRSSIREPVGLVFDIQRFSVQDGPGIRTTVFLKGCRLDCLWCSNPESKISRPSLIVREIKCKRCGACKEACPEGAITLHEEEGRKIDWAKCNQCLRCVDACIYGSLNTSGRELTLSQIVEEVLSDQIFYETSNGGVTISGGEPLVQAEFLLALLKALKSEGLHTTLDTSGFAPWPVLESVLPFVDLLLYDVKQLDLELHRKMTGVGNEKILENLRKAAMSTPVWLRLPLIAGFNDSQEHIRGLVALAKEVRAEKISLLPYHEGGKSKCRQIGAPYEFDQGSTPDDEHVARLEDWIERRGIPVSIGS